VLTLKEAIKVFKVSQATMYRWIKKDAIKCKIIGGLRYYDIDELQNAYQKRHIN
jgi:predicted site-specific integrase-resolvase